MRKLNGSRPLMISAALTAILFCPTAQSLYAQNSTAAETAPQTGAGKPDRIAFVNIQEIIAGCEEGRHETDNWRQWAEKKQAELKGMQKELDDLQNRLKVQADKLTEDARFELEDSIDDKGTLLQRAQQDLQQEADKRQRRVTNTIYRKALPVIEKIAEDKGFDLVQFFDINRDAYIRPALYITDEVIAAYDKAYPVEKAGLPVEK